MRIVIDLQGAQSASRFRGIGRYSLSLTQALVRNKGINQIDLLLNGLFTETLEYIYDSFKGLLPLEHIHVWNGCGPASYSNSMNTYRIEASEILYESYVAKLNPDILFFTSVVEGFDDDVVISKSKIYNFHTASIFYDLIPLMNPEQYLPKNSRLEEFYFKRVDVLKKSDLLFGISQSSCKEAIDILKFEDTLITNINSGCDQLFTKIKISQDIKKIIQEKFLIGESFIMYSGATDERKNHIRLIEAYASLDTKIRNEYQLVIAGGMPEEHRLKFLAHIKKLGLTTKQVVLTGRVTDEEMLWLYSLTDLFVFPSWHEGFGLPALEAMYCGAPVIGSDTTSIPEVIGLEDALFNPFDVQSIASKITAVLMDENFKMKLAKHSLIQSKKFSWDKSSIKVLERLEEWFQENCRKDRLSDEMLSIKAIQSIASLSLQPIESDIVQIAHAIARDYPPEGKKSIFIDVSELFHRDSQTGVQRVVRSIAKEMQKDYQSQYSVYTVYADTMMIGYKYTFKFLESVNNEQRRLDGENIDFKKGDIFLGLDLVPHIVPKQYPFYLEMKSKGVKINFVVYDILPIFHPEWWPQNGGNIHTEWLKTIAQVSDKLVSISKAVSEEVEMWIEQNNIKTPKNIEYKYFHLGADIDNSTPSKGLPKNSQEVLGKFESTKTFLMVGTLEPRKGHKQTLLAFEALWKNDENINLVIVGKQGWMMDNFIAKIKNHSELNKKLFWLEGISDEYLEKVYAASACLITASEGEGFGLPLIEAAQHKLPIIVRDIPIFKEVAGEYAYYFENDNDSAVLEKTIVEWLEMYQNGMHPKSDEMPWLTWEESSEQLIEKIVYE